MRNYVDVHINLNVFTGDPKSSMDKIRELGFKSIAITYFEFNPRLKLDCTLQNSGLDIASRIQLKPRNRTELLKELRIFRSKFEIIGVKCVSMEVARVAARDSRVDMISFPLENPRVRLSKKLASACNTAVEINARELVNAKQPRYVTLRRLIDEVDYAASNGLRLIVSSGATNQLELLSPMDLASIHTVLGVGRYESLKTVSENPYSIIRRNRMKLRGSLISEWRASS